MCHHGGQVSPFGTGVAAQRPRVSRAWTRVTENADEQADDVQHGQRDGETSTPEAGVSCGLAVRQVRTPVDKPAGGGRLGAVGVAGHRPRDRRAHAVVQANEPAPDRRRRHRLVTEPSQRVQLRVAAGRGRDETKLHLLVGLEGVDEPLAGFGTAAGDREGEELVARPGLQSVDVGGERLALARGPGVDRLGKPASGGAVLEQDLGLVVPLELVECPGEGRGRLADIARRPGRDLDGGRLGDVIDCIGDVEAAGTLVLVGQADVVGGAFEDVLCLVWVRATTDNGGDSTGDVGCCHRRAGGLGVRAADLTARRRPDLDPRCREVDLRSGRGEEGDLVVRVGRRHPDGVLERGGVSDTVLARFGVVAAVARCRHDRDAVVDGVLDRV